MRVTRWLAVAALAACRGTPDTPAIGCDRLADAIVALYDREPGSVTAGLVPELRARVRDGAVSRCEVAAWDDVERACVLAVRDFDALIDCQIAGHRRRHPEWRWR